MTPAAAPVLARLKERALRLKAETYALYLAARHPGTPLYAKLLVAGIVAYALSPVDLIPDFVPILGYLDEIVLLPLGIAVAIRLIPDSVLEECRKRSREAFASGRPVSWTAAIVVIVVWISLAVLGAGWAYFHLCAA